MENKAKELLARIWEDPYNEVSAHAVEGGIALTLSHRITMDVAATVFVPEDRILFHDNPADGDLLEKLNLGGNWEGGDV